MENVSSRIDFVVPHIDDWPIEFRFANFFSVSCTLFLFPILSQLNDVMYTADSVKKLK